MIGDATHGDRVLVEWKEAAPFRSRQRTEERRPARGGKRPPRADAAPPPERPRRYEGKVVRVLERSTAKVIGKVLVYKVITVIPLDNRYHYSIVVDDDGGFRLNDGDVVQVEITSPPTSVHRPRGRIVGWVGEAGDKELPLKIILARHEIRTEFPPEALAEAGSLPDDIDPAVLEGREDFRNLEAVTIDGETAHDFDDAVNVRLHPDGHFTLWVHIADVSHYVAPGGALDTEAFIRGTSVYFPDRAVPMLPPRLSSDLCSLLPDRDRLTFTAVMDIDGKSGKIKRARFAPSVIRSRARMTYTQVAKILQGDEALCRQFSGLVLHFKVMEALFLVLNRRRRKLGAIDFDLPESVVLFDAEGNVADVVRSERTDAHRIIEEFMLAANEAVAVRLTQDGGEALYRVHDLPDPLKVEEFAQTAARFGYDFTCRSEEPEPGDFQRIADALEGSPAGRFLSFLMLRSFKLAAYSENNIGHFGLALKDYTHFTSPIRRYPDLVVHRLLRHSLAGPARKSTPAWGPADMPHIAVQSSEREREAMEAERECVAWKKAEFMQAHLGEDYEGCVSGMKPNGFFVELTEHFLEGFVNLATLSDDFYEFDEERYLFRGQTGGRVFRLGDPVKVRVARVDSQRHQVDFALADLPAGKGPETAERKLRKRIRRDR